MKNSKIQPRELTEEEKAEQEAKGAKGGKAPPKGKNPKDDEPTPEELEKQEQARLEKEELERQRAAEWETLDEETKFFRTNEDIYKEPSIRMHNQVSQRRLDQLQEQLTQLSAAEEVKEDEKARVEAEIAEVQKQTLIGVSMSEKQGFELIEVEEAIKNDGGCWLTLMKLPQPEAPAEEKGGKKAPPAKKG